ncbi:MAG TPA: DUF1345 domain-containing protein, partial [Bacteroidia bacterium]|nr:DUF1345 domain-containing protein [Bacteroidia bacterium]
MSNDVINGPFLSRISATKRLLLSAAAAICLVPLLSFTGINIFTRIILGWDFFNVIMIVTSWTIFFTTSSKALAAFAAQQDETLPASFTIILISICISLFGTLLLMHQNYIVADKKLHTVASYMAVALSWLLLHTIFTLRYAHLYFIPNENNQPSKGLIIESDKELDYIDFAYFAFVVGMTFQVSDITINSQRIRRFTLAHGIIAFVFNTIILALAIST